MTMSLYPFFGDMGWLVELMATETLPVPGR